MTQTSKHLPVLLDEVIRLLAPQPGDVYLDGTAGYGGHAEAVIQRIGTDGHAILVDRDRQAVTTLHQRFASLDNQVEVIRRDYASAASELLDSGRLVDMVLLDLGVSSPQLDIPERGFSFRSNGPLDMRMDQTQGLTAADVVNRSSQTELANILYKYGEERRSRRIARAIVDRRPIQTTAELADIVAGVLGRAGDIHPATRTFQALRIYVNGELDQLEQALPDLVSLLKPGGRIVVISFHSLEDRLVKTYFNQQSRDCICPPGQPICTCDHIANLKKLTRKAISGTNDAFNPRARSAKLRAAVKINKKQKE